MAAGPTTPLDATIASLKDATLGYPLDYGYSLSGIVVRAAAGVPPSLLGQRVFAFPHASAAVAAADGVRPVPDGVGASDAVYLPALETALSIAHDAHVRPGESTLVVGQGLIGLLVTAVLARAPGADVVAVDPLDQRRALARKLGATRTLARAPRPPTRAAAASMWRSR